MKKLTTIASLLLCLLLIGPAAQAQEKNEDARYLAGAVPEVEGKVVFTKEYCIPGMTQDEVFDRMLQWMDARLKENKNDSRVLYSNKEKGQIVGTVDEWIVFSSNALSLDRTRLLAQFTVLCQPEACTFSVEKIRYIYREGEERYTAEEWITDKYALNKSQTKLVRGLAKWRRKTVDYMDNLFQQAADALSAVPDETAVEPAPEAVQEAATPKRQVVITPKNKVTVQPAKATPTAPVVSPTPAPAATKQASPDELSDDLIQPNAGRLVIVIGDDPFNQTMMTANAGGSLGRMNGRRVVFTILSPEQSHDLLDSTDTYTVRFYPNGSTVPSVELQCRKLASPETPEGMPRTYVGEILKATVQ